LARAGKRISCGHGGREEKIDQGLTNGEEKIGLITSEEGQPKVNQGTPLQNENARYEPNHSEEGGRVKLQRERGIRGGVHLNGKKEN